MNENSLNGFRWRENTSYTKDTILYELYLSEYDVVIGGIEGRNLSYCWVQVLQAGSEELET